MCRVPFHFSNPAGTNEHNDNQQEIHKTGCPVPTKGIGTPSERCVTKPEILALPEVSLECHDASAAFVQYLQRLRVLGAEPGIEPMLQNEADGDAAELDNDQDCK
jgi:hypothetical protein